MVASKRDHEVRTFELIVGDASLSVDVRVRGKSRLRVCDFPPLRLDLRGSRAEGTAFEGQGRLKLVSHCRRSRPYENNVVEEYAAYRILSLLTPLALDARLLRVRYVDTTHPGQEPLERYAFVIESVDELADRVGGSRIRRASVTQSSLERQQLAAVFVFQYLIGNTDWSLVRAHGEAYCCHNGELLERDGRLLYIPYDFDFSGLVNAHYAKPLPEIGIRTVRTRRYRGYCLEGLDLEAAIRSTGTLETTILGLVGALPAEDDRARKARVHYLERFFDEARDVDALVRKFERSCIG